jgi:outer membrane receptor protein involved in Fe transport
MQILLSAMTKKNLLIIVLIIILTILYGLPAHAQERVTISGTITDSKSNETLIGATIYIEELKTGVSTNEYGFYSITIPSGDYTIWLSYIGYLSAKESISLTGTIKKDFSLVEDSKTLNEVVINANKEIADIRVPEMSTNKLSIQTIKQMPVVLGEVDIIKSILQLPGVTNAGEGQSGFNVRGGSADQNLVLLDEATIYNTSHVFGLFSVFNADAVKDLKLYKGGIPARYGGRLSSVLDIYQKEGNKNSFNVLGGIGLISSRLLAEAPIAKGRGSFIAAGRGSYAHLFLKLADNKNSASFYDLNTKISYKLNEKNQLFLSGYFGKDIFDLNGQFTQRYGNSFANLRWNHLFSDKLFSNLSLIYSDYFYGLKVGVIGLDWDFGIQNFNLKYDFKHYLGNATKLTYGINSQYFHFNPGTIKPIDEKSGINAEQLAKKFALESAIYLDVEQSLTKQITINYGLRYSTFYRLGRQNVNVYANNQAVVFNSVLGIYEKATPIGVKTYGDNETIARFNNFEPRAAVSFAFNDNQSVKVSYNRMAQYLHLISNTQSPTPLDLWTPSDNFLKPQILDQVAIGYFRNFNNDKYSLEIESFYKDIKNRVDYIDGAQLIANRAIEQVVLNGKARSYGLELMVKKNTGNLTGWVSYTLSRSEQQTLGRTANEIGINNGQWYKTNFDKLHNLSVTVTYKRNEKWSFSGIFNLQSGIPSTYPDGKYEYQGISVPNFELRNGNKLPTYHRLDLSATYTPKPKKEKGWRGEWVFSIYNVYNQQNAASISFRQNDKTAANEAVRFSVFGIVPGITYNFKF